MRAHLIAVGERMPAWVTEGYNEYAKRLIRDLPLQLVEISTKLRGRTNDIERVIADEGALMCAAIPKGAQVVALDGRGKAYGSEQLAQQLERWRMHGGQDLRLRTGPDAQASIAKLLFGVFLLLFIVFAVLALLGVGAASR